MTLTLATTLAGLVAAVSPLALRYVRLDGVQKAAASYVLALFITVAAGLLTGDLHFDRASLLTVLGGSGAFWSVQQGVYQILSKVAPQLVWAPPSSSPSTRPAHS